MTNKISTRLSFKKLVLLSTCSILLTACSGGWFGDSEEARLEGERVPLFDQAAEPEIPTVTDASSDSSTDTASESDYMMSADTSDIQLDFISSEAWRNEFWPQAGGYANHAMQHLALSSPIQKAWSASIGKGSEALPLGSQPIVVDNKVFTLDSNATLKAFDANSGDTLWTLKLMKEGEGEPVGGGGVAFSGGQLFVTNGFNEVISVDPFDGEILWRTGIAAPARATPSAVEGRVFVVTQDNRTIALNAADGAPLWEHQGLNESSGVLGTASPAATRSVVISAYSSGEVYALRAENGSVSWSDQVSGVTVAKSGKLADIRALPVIDKGLIFAVSYSGKIVAIDERTGKRVWQENLGSDQTPWVAGNRVFLIDQNNRVVSLDRTTGRIDWATQMEKYKKPEDREGVIKWVGPVYAGGRLLAFSSEGDTVELDPATGASRGGFKISDSVRVSPTIAGESLYLLTNNGTLSAWR